jgi:hypothetical protein
LVFAADPRSGRKISFVWLLGAEFKRTFGKLADLMGGERAVNSSLGISHTQLATEGVRLFLMAQDEAELNEQPQMPKGVSQ